MKKTVIGENEKAALEKREEEKKARTDTVKQYVLDKNKARPNIFVSDVSNSFNKLILNKKVIGPALVKVYIN
jgi:hypothetical protein